eukprot:UN28610
MLINQNYVAIYSQLKDPELFDILIRHVNNSSISDLLCFLSFENIIDIPEKDTDSFHIFLQEKVNLIPKIIRCLSCDHITSNKNKRIMYKIITNQILTIIKLLILTIMKTDNLDKIFSDEQFDIEEYQEAIERFVMNGLNSRSYRRKQSTDPHDIQQTNNENNNSLDSL